MFITRVLQSLNEAKVDYAIVGGLAVALHGAVRGTVDLDLVVRTTRKDFVSVEKVLSSLGLRSRQPVRAEEVFQFRKEYIAKRNMVAWTFVNPDRASEIVDVILTHDRSKMKVVKKVLGGISVSVVAIPDLIAMKEAVGRPQDLEDIRALRRLNK